jgi:hypothetical protein
MEGNRFIGGCEGLANKVIAATLVVVALLMLYYVVMFIRDARLLSAVEGMCGGLDQLCHCAGNETFRVRY